RREAHQREEDRRKRRGSMQELVTAGRNIVLLEEHFQGVGKDVRESECAGAQDWRAVCAQAILHYGRLLSLHPCEQRGHDQDRVDKKKSLDEQDQHVEPHKVSALRRVRQVMKRVRSSSTETHHGMRVPGDMFSRTTNENPCPFGKDFRGRQCTVETARRAVSTSSRDTEKSRFWLP